MQLKGSLIQGTPMLKLVECLKARFDKPQLIHHTHVQMIIEAPSRTIVTRNCIVFTTIYKQHIRYLKTLESDFHNFYD